MTASSGWIKDSGSETNVPADRGKQLEIVEVLTMVSSPIESKWIMDSGCSFHVCPNKDWFKDLEPIDGEKVLMATIISAK